MQRARFSFFFMALAVLLVACDGIGQSEEKSDNTGLASDDRLVMQVQQCSRLYSTEYVVRKVVGADSRRTVEGLGLSLDLDLLGSRKVVVPIEATIKGYIDLSLFTARNVSHEDGLLVITLPDPEVLLTSTKVRQDELRQYVTGLRDAFTDAELTQLESQGRDAIIADIPRLGIERTARQNAVRLLIPLLGRLGYDEANIIIRFRSDFTPADLIRKFD